MSIKTTPTTEVTLDTTEVTVSTNTEVSTDVGTVHVDVEPQQEVLAIRKEYSVVGDAFYTGLSSNEAPAWLAPLVDSVVNTAVSNGLTDYDLLVQAVQDAISSIDVASNTYAKQVDFTALENGIAGTVVTTVNATYGDTLAQIVDIDTIVATTDEAISLRAASLEAAFSAEISSSILSIETAYTNADSAFSTSIDELTTAFEDQETGLSGVASAVSGLHSQVGLIDGTGTPDGTGMLSRLLIVEKQADGVIETISDEYDVILNPQNPLTAELITGAEPYAGWWSDDNTAGNEDVRLAHIGDVYIKYSTASNGTKEYIASYKFIKTVVDSTGPYYSTDAEGFTWSVIIDQAAQDAYEQALNAYDLADGKRRVFTDTPYVPYDKGDLWVRDVSGSSQIFVATSSKTAGYLLSDWRLASTDNQYAIDIESGTRQIDLSGNLSAIGWDNSISAINLEIGGIDTAVLQNALDTAALDGVITAVEQDYLAAIILEQGTRAQALIDEADSRGVDISGVTSAYENYILTVKNALIDGEITAAEQSAINIAATALETAETAINVSLGNLESRLDSVDTKLADDAILISNLDGLISAEESARISDILAAQEAAASALVVREEVESLLDGKITGNEQESINAALLLKTEVKTYSELVAASIYDGILTPEELALISDASGNVAAAKAIYEALVLKAANTELLASEVETLLAAEIVDRIQDISIVVGSVTSETTARTEAILAESSARISAIAQEVGDRNLAISGTATQLVTDYTKYSELVMTAMADGELTPEEATLISASLTQVNITKNRLAAIETNSNTISDSVNSERDLRVAAIAGITDTGGSIDEAKDAITLAYKEYTEAYDSAIVSGDINSAEAAAIADAESKLESARLVLESAISDNYDDLKSQIDNTITTWFNDYVPSVNNEPWSSWNNDNSLLNAHLGDIFYDTSTGTGYRFVYTSAYGWVTITDSAITGALEVASTAQTTADGKTETSVGTLSNIPTFSSATANKTIAQLKADANGDLYIASDENNKLYRYNGSSWVDVRDITSDKALDNFLTVTYAQDLLGIGSQIDGKSNSYFQDSTPFNPSTGSVNENGDTWYSISTKVLKVYNFGNLDWELVTDPYIQGAYDDAALAQASADGKIQNFTSEPETPYYLGDTWMQGSNGNIYVCKVNKASGDFSQSDWLIASKYTDDTRVVLLETGLSDGTVSIDLSTATIDGTTLLTAYVADELDGVVTVFSGSDVDAETGMETNDLYVETTLSTATNGVTYDVVKVYKYGASSWTEQTGSTGNIAALRDLTDGKRTIFNTAAPTGMIERDMWIPNVAPTDTTKIVGEVYIYVGTVWVLATKYTENLDAFVGEVNPKVATLQNQTDGKLEYYFFDVVLSLEAAELDNIKATYLTAEVVEAANGNIAYNRTTDNGYWYSSSTDSWSVIEQTDVLKSLKVAETAQGAADGKVSSFFAWGGPTTPTDYTVVTRPIEHSMNEYGEYLDLNDNVTTTPSEYVTIAAEESSVVKADDFHYWYLIGTGTVDDGKVYRKVSGTWVGKEVVPKVAGNGSYISEGDVLSVWDTTKVDGTGTPDVLGNPRDELVVYSYNGTNWQTTGPEGIVSKSRFFVDLDNAVSGPLGVAKSLSNLEITSKAYSNETAIGVENKFAYDSKIILGGKVYEAGFGLDSLGTVNIGTPEAPVFDSTFRVNAERFVLTSPDPALAGVEASFTVNANGLYITAGQTEATVNQSDTDANNIAQGYVNDVNIGGTNLVSGSKDASLNAASSIIGGVYNGFTVSSASHNGSGYRDGYTFVVPELNELEYTLSFLAKADADNVTIRSYSYSPNNTISALNSQGNSASNSDGGVNTTLSNVWEKYWITWKQSSTSIDKNFIISRLTSDNQVSIAAVKLEVGNKASDWSPSIEDVQKDAAKYTDSLSDNQTLYTTIGVDTDILPANSPTATGVSRQSASDKRSDFIPVKQGEKLHLEMWAKKASSNDTVRAYMGLQRYDKDKKPIGGNSGTTYVGLANTSLSTSWVKYIGVAVMPTSHNSYYGSDGGAVCYIKVRLLYNYGTTGQAYYSNFRLFRGLTSGTVGGWNIMNNAIFTGSPNGNGYAASNSMTLHAQGSIHTPYFYTQPSGAGFKGSVTAGAGSVIAGAYISDLTVDTIKIKNNAVTLTTMVNLSQTKPNGSTQVTSSFTLTSPYLQGDVLFNMSCAKSITSGSSGLVYSNVRLMRGTLQIGNALIFSDYIVAGRIQTTAVIGGWSESELSSGVGGTITMQITTYGTSSTGSGIAYYRGSTIHVKK